MLGSADFEDTFLGLLGLLRQKGEVLLLKMVSWGLCNVGMLIEYVLARICSPAYSLAHTAIEHARRHFKVKVDYEPT